MLRRIRGTPLARHTFWIAGGQVLRFGIQTLYFVLLARTLGSRDFGTYAAVLAIVAVAAPFASLGAGSLLIKHVAKTPEVFGRYWGKALGTTLVSGALLLALVTAISAYWLPDGTPLGLIIAVGAADLLFVRLVDISAQAYQAFHRLGRTAMLQLLLSPLRLLAALVLLAITQAPTLSDWGLVYVLSAAVGAVLAVPFTTRELGWPTFRGKDLTSEVREGSYFSVSLSAQTFTNDIDKAMLARLSTLEATGIYGAGYRLVDVAFLPVWSVLVATYARYFQHGAQGVRAAARYARPFLLWGVVYGLMAAAALYVLAPALPILLGEEYRSAIAAIRWLAILPLLKAIHYFGASALMGAGYQGSRTLIQIVIAAGNVGLNAWLIPRYSWRGAALATLASDLLLGVGLWAATWYYARRADGTGQGRPGVASRSST